MIGILGTLAEFELSRSKERQAEGIAKAKKKPIKNATQIKSLNTQLQKVKSLISVH